MGENLQFSIWDYVVFSASLVCSLGIGIYYACTGGKQRTTSEYLMANRKMSYGPVALSVMVTFMSAISILGTCAEIYMRGTDFCFLMLGYFICFPVVAHVFIPVFYHLRITSVFEYLEMRFSSIVRTCGTVVYILMMVIYMGVVLYTPALALNAVTSVNTWMVICVIAVVCTIYTTLGGLKAVIWTDVYQATVMFVSQLVIIGVGAWKVGGFGQVFKVALETRKMDTISINPSPFEVHTLWTLSLGGAIMCINLYGTNQSAVQRYLSCKSLRHAQITAYLNLPLLILFMVINGLLGLVMYATYYCENPLATGAVEKPDQLLIYFVMDLLGGYPGLPGLFVASLFCAALSTISSCFNSLATVTMQDLIRPQLALTDSQATFWSKIIAMLYGFLCIIMSFLASYMGSVLIAALSIFGIVGGPLLGLFVFGIFFRCGNAKGAIAGFVTSLAVIFWIGFGGITYRIQHATKPTYLLMHETCEIDNGTLSTMYWNSTFSPPTTFTATTNVFNSTVFNSNVFNSTVFNSTEADKEELYTGIHFIYKLSYLWYSGLSTLIVVVVGLLVSLCTGGNPHEYDEETFHKLVRKKRTWKVKQDKSNMEMKNIEIELRMQESDPLNATLIEQ